MSKNKAQKARSSDLKERQYSTFKTVFVYCIAIILMPIITFFGTKVFIFDGLLELSRVSSNIYAAISAVIALHIALFAYLYKAYFDGEREKVKQPSKKSDLDKQD